MDLSGLSTVKQLLLMDEFVKAMLYFCDNFATQDAFLEMGQTTTNKVVDGMLEAVAHRLFGQGVGVSNTRLVELPDRHFIHGHFDVTQKTGIVIYCTDVGRGVIAIGEDYTPFTVSGPFTGDAPTGLARYRRKMNSR